MGDWPLTALDLGENIYAYGRIPAVALGFWVAGQDRRLGSFPRTICSGTPEDRKGSSKTVLTRFIYTTHAQCAARLRNCRILIALGTRHAAVIIRYHLKLDIRRVPFIITAMQYRQQFCLKRRYRKDFILAGTESLHLETRVLANLSEVAIGHRVRRTSSHQLLFKHQGQLYWQARPAVSHL